MTTGCPLPEAEPQTGLHVLRGLARDRSLLTAMAIMRDEVGPAFRITLPGFQPAVMVGPMDADGFVGPMTAIDLP